jgi:hypothetical protein
MRGVKTLLIFKQELAAELFLNLTVALFIIVIALDEHSYNLCL